MRTCSYLISLLMCLGWLAFVQPARVAAAETMDTVSVEKSGRHRYRRHSHSGIDSRHHRPRWHRRYYRTHVYHPYVHYRPYWYYPPVVWVEPAPVVFVEPVVVSTPVPEEGAEVPSAVVAEAAPAAPPAPEPLGASIHFRLDVMSMSDTQLATETIRGADLVGFGAACRFDVHRHWMVELGLEVLGWQDDGIEQVTIPMTASAIAHLFPESTWDPYGVAGLGLLFTEMDDPNYSEVERYLQMAGHVGAGLEVHLGDLVLSSDLRMLVMPARPERQYQETVGQGLQQDEFIPTVRDGTTPTDTTLPSSGYSDSDEVSLAIQFLMGLGWRF